jgi:hypothetical protein
VVVNASATAGAVRAAAEVVRPALPAAYDALLDARRRMKSIDQRELFTHRDPSRGG